MAIVKMKRMELVGLNSERKRLIEYLQKCGIVDISDSKCGILESRETVRSIAMMESNLSEISEVLSMIPHNKKGFFEKRKEINSSEYVVRDGEFSELMNVVRELQKIRKTTAKNKEELSYLATEEKILESYINLDIPPNIKGTKLTDLKMGTLEGEWTEERLLKKLKEKELNAVHFEIIKNGKQQSIVWFMYLTADDEKMKSFFTELGFVAAKNTGKDEPKKRILEISRRKEEIEIQNTEFAEKIEKYGEKRAELELLYDKMSVRCDKYKALKNVGITDKTFFITGYVPESEADALGKSLAGQFSVAVEFVKPEKEEDVPVKLKNNSFVEPVEGITTDYSMPSKHDVDPNPVMAGFYYFFFGMMFSDAGYGLLLMIVCGLLGFGNFIDKTKRRAYKMFFFCGVSTTFWGIMYGSFFGDMIATVSKTFGSGQLAFLPVLVDPVKKPLTVLIMSVAFGTFHILVAMAVKFYVTWRNGEKWAAIFDTGFWMLVISGIGILATGLAFSIDWITKTGEVMAIGGAIGLVLTQGRTSKNPVLKLFNGILSLYDITSIVGDVLSYSRLMALGLATGVIASVINVLGSLGGNSVIGLISFVVISLFGHTLNFAINMLGAYVHTNRLQYVEFYQKFYEGGGRKYEPLSFKTKYYEFK